MIENKKNLVVTINEDLHHQLKIYCAEQKTTIKEVIIKLISEELDKNRKELINGKRKNNCTTH